MEPITSHKWCTGSLRTESLLKLSVNLLLKHESLLRESRGGLQALKTRDYLAPMMQARREQLCSLDAILRITMASVQARHSCPSEKSIMRLLTKRLNESPDAGQPKEAKWAVPGYEKTAGPQVHACFQESGYSFCKRGLVCRACREQRGYKRSIRTSSRNMK